ncbi:MAG: SpoIIE family protein phosphatase [Chloroherpetonaceae bacterium]|nr:SpoIIE family protein phosphatase [Chloroherpetonaceae bacterium]
MPESGAPSPLSALDKSTEALGTLDLNSLLETSKILNASLNLEFILSHILRTAMGKFLVSKAAIITFSTGEDLIDIYHLASSRGLTGAPQNFTDLEAFGIQFDLNLLVPIASQKRMIGFIALGKKLNKSEFSEAERDFIGTLASLAAIAIDNADRIDEMERVNRSLDLSVQKLKTLFEQAKNYSPNMPREELLKMLFNAVSGQMMIRGMVALREEDGNLVVELTRGGLSIEHIPKSELQSLLNLSLPEKLSKEKYPELVNAGFVIAIPMRGSTKNLGVILSSGKFSDQSFSDSDLDFLFLAVSQAATTIEQSRLFAEALEKEVIEKELQVAREIQAMLLPKELPKFRGVEIAAVNIPSLQVGGDYYDIIKLDDRHIFIGIADVTGKGTPAALLMANLQASIKAYMQPFQVKSFDLAGTIANINNIIYENTPADKFITFFGGILDLETRIFHSVNAGHNPPYVITQQGEVKSLTAGGVILGVVPKITYESQKTKLERSEVLFLYTDGITEAENASKELFEPTRLLELLKATRDETALSILNRVIDAVRAFQPPGKQIDDITAICVKVGN